MIKASYNLIILVLFLNSCAEKKAIIEKTDYKTHYKFASEIEDKVENDTVSWKYQISAADYASKGDYKNALEHWDLAMGSAEKNYDHAQIDSINALYRKIPAKEYILEKAIDEQVLIINEAHHSSHHRFFTKSLLKELFSLGYTNLGLEALGNGEYLDTLLLKRKYPVQETGWYIIEPQFGDLVREAIEIGYNVFPYEQTSDSNGKLREIEQAQNISEIIEQRPSEKFLIHCGFDHALEGTHASWEKAMAGRLKEFTGIDPLTINQVVYSEKSDPKFNNRFLKAINPSGSTILIDKENKPYRYSREEAWSDIAIFHPNTEYINNRPDWIFTNNNRKVKIDLSALDISYPILVMAFKEGEDADIAVPVDIFEVSYKEDYCFLGLPKGDHVIIVTNGTESLRFDKTVK